MKGVLELFKRNKRGYILIFTMVFIFISSAVVLNIFRVVLLERKHNYLLSEYIQKSNKFQKEQECLLTELSDTIRHSISEINEESIKKFMILEMKDNKIHDGVSCLMYDAISNKVIIESRVDLFMNYVNTYRWIANNGDISFKLIDSAYVRRENN